MTTSRQFPRLFAALSFVSALVHAAPAAAEGQDEAAARALFLDGRQLVKAGHYDEACTKFEAAKKLYTSAGLLLNLADCDEHANRTASAWTEFGDAASAAATAGRQDDAIEAKRRQAALEGRLSRLTIRMTAAARDQVVKRDGVPIDRAAWDSAIPVDPGVHAIVAEAPDRSPWSASVSVTEPGRTMVVEIPELRALTANSTRVLSPASDARGETLGSASQPLDASPSGTFPGTSQRMVGLVVGGAGVLGLGASGVLSLLSRSRYDSAVGEMDGSRRRDSLTAVELADGATIAVAIGGAAVIAGAAIWLTAPTAPVLVGTNGHELFLLGSFQ